MNHDELAFLAEVSSVNQAIAVYIGRVLDIDGGRTEYSAALPEVEQQLAARLFAIAIALQANATGRIDATDVPLLIEAGTEQA
ncbi:hypothetical protein [Actinokineospora xionganensis]|uniref:Uncharacterized protein n=1 Tax=Actinokineospora xionganensis TaxID=2684470 RepID=A0ABR7LE81_9PSEU|nr:hypothetical protein [Actinokineospora xionganensis]MBC6451006.1 hypothetical protein [Actinokineospora xionganensis]